MLSHLSPAYIEKLRLRLEAGSQRNPETGCLEWVGSLSKSGYAQIWVTGLGCSRAHRVVWALNHGDPGEMSVCHECDNPKCIDIDHLWLGSHLENMKDCHKKLRGAYGNRSGNSKLTTEQCLLIVSDERTLKSIADHYDVSIYTIFCIKKGITWGKLTGKEFTKEGCKKGVECKSSKITDSDVIEIFKDSRRQCDIAEAYGIGQSQVSRIKNRQNWTDITENL